MRVVTSKAVLLGLIIASTNLYAEDYNFKPGLWKTTWTMEITELNAPPEMEKMIRSLYEESEAVDVETECINDLEQYLKDDEYENSEDDDEDERKCKINKKRISANKLVTEESCTSNHGTSISVTEINLNGDTATFNGKTEMSDDLSSMRIKLKAIGSAKYIGPCKSEPNE